MTHQPDSVDQRPPAHDPYEDPAGHLIECQQRFRRHLDDRTRADLVGALLHDAAHLVRTAWPAAHQAVVMLDTAGRRGPQPRFARLLARRGILVERSHLPHLWPEDSEALCDGLQAVYAAIELAGRDGLAADSWSARYAAAVATMSTNPSFGQRPWHIGTTTDALADAPARTLVITLPPQRRTLATLTRSR